MRKVIFILVALLATALQGRAQTQAITAGEDSTINVVAWFNKNDTTEYVYTKSNVLVSDGDTTRTGNTEEMFRLVVADSTSDGYRLKFEPISWKSDNSKDSLKSSLMWAAKSQAPVVFDTNEYGKIERLEKWRDVRDKAIPAITGYFEKLYAKNPAIDSIMPKKNYLSLLRLGFNNEDAIREMYSEVTGLFSCHGKAFNIGMTNDEDSTTGYPTHLTTIVSYEDVDTTDAESYLGDYFIRNSSIVTIPSDEAKALTIRSLALSSRRISLIRPSRSSTTVSTCRWRYGCSPTTISSTPDGRNSFVNRRLSRWERYGLTWPRRR